MLLVFLMYMTRQNWVPSRAGHAMRSSSRGIHDLQNPCKEGLSVLYLVYCSLSPFNIGAACRDTNPLYSFVLYWQITSSTWVQQQPTKGDDFREERVDRSVSRRT
jgi:hypothetical protein